MSYRKFKIRGWYIKQGCYFNTSTTNSTSSTAIATNTVDKSNNNSNDINNKYYFSAIFREFGNLVQIIGAI